MAKRWSTKPTGATKRIADWLNDRKHKAGEVFVPPATAFFARKFGCSAWNASRAVKKWRKAQAKPRGYAASTPAQQARANTAITWDIEKDAYGTNTIRPLTDHTDYAAMVSDIENVADLIDAAVEKPLAVRAGCALLKALVSRKRFSVTFDTKEWKIPTKTAGTRG